MGKKMKTAAHVVAFGASLGAGMIVGFAVAAVVPAGAGRITRALVVLGTGALGGAAGEVAGNTTLKIFADVDALFSAGKDLASEAKTILVEETSA